MRLPDCLTAIFDGLKAHFVSADVCVCREKPERERFRARIQSVRKNVHVLLKEVGNARRGMSVQPKSIDGGAGAGRLAVELGACTAMCMRKVGEIDRMSSTRMRE